MGKGKKKMIPYTIGGCLLLMIVVVFIILGRKQSTKVSSSNTYPGEVRISPYIKGYEWGPGVTKLIVRCSDTVSVLEDASVKVKTNREKRKVTRVYTSDERGEEIQEKSSYLTLELETVSARHSGNPLVYDRLRTLHNNWVKKYPVVVEGLHIKTEQANYIISVEENCIDNFYMPEFDLFKKRGTYTGRYYNPCKGKEEEVTLNTAAYEPEQLAGGKKNPLIVWLHGGGEGGNDISTVIYGNQISALAEERIQSYFHAGEETGAYVLTVQCPTFWMDEGDGKNGEGSNESRFTKILMDTIKEYVDNNADIDTDRIYVGGCSNGGYMTVQMFVHYPDYFAAGFPVCAAYAYRSFTKEGLYFTEEKAKRLANKPLWFVQAANDTVVSPMLFGLPIYQQILKAGNDNCWYSYFENVIGTDDKEEDYLGHFSWIYLFHDQVKGVQDREAIRKGEEAESYGFIPNNADGGGNSRASEGSTTYTSLFQWLNAQKRTS